MCSVCIHLCVSTHAEARGENSSAIAVHLIFVNSKIFITVKDHYIQLVAMSI